MTAQQINDKYSTSLSFIIYDHFSQIRIVISHAIMNKKNCQKGCMSL